MLKDISIGRYYKGNSVLHQLDPRLKILLFIAYLVGILMGTKLWTVAAIAIVAIVISIIGKLPLKVLWNSIKPILPIAIMIFILNMLTMKNGNTLFEYWIIRVTDKGLIQAFLMAWRLLMLVLITSILLTLTTTPLRLADALEYLLNPLKKIKFPVHEMAMMMSIALRFIPTLIDETDKIMKAQVSRGADYDTGSFMNRVKGYITVLIPLFISSFRRAEELAIAMEARCYNGGIGRTKLNPLHITKQDIGVFALLIVFAGVFVLVENIM